MCVCACKEGRYAEEGRTECMSRKEGRNVKGVKEGRPRKEGRNQGRKEGDMHVSYEITLVHACAYKHIYI